jgi:hypothetical protein
MRATPVFSSRRLPFRSFRGAFTLIEWREGDTGRLKGLDNAAKPGNRDLQRFKEATYQP